MHQNHHQKTESHLKIHTVTISGADDQTPPNQLLAISEAYPFVEWGILLTPGQEPRQRYPTLAWIHQLESLMNGAMKVSGHVCGGWAKKICRGQFSEELDRPMFTRMQLNLAHFIAREISDFGTIASCLPMDREYIVQVGAAEHEGLRLAHALQNHGHLTSVLFDASGGHGLTPDRWPEPVSNLKCGFAGGLSPHNLENQLRILSAHVGDTTMWIDMESGVRTEDGQELDLDKVRACLDIVQPYVAKGRKENGSNQYKNKVGP